MLLDSVNSSDYFVQKSHKQLEPPNNDALKLLISHYPFLGPMAQNEQLKPSETAALRLFAPQLVITAHAHVASMSWCYNCLNTENERVTAQFG